MDFIILSYILALLKSFTISIKPAGYIKTRFVKHDLGSIQDIINFEDIYKIVGAVMVLDIAKMFLLFRWLAH